MLLNTLLLSATASIATAISIERRAAITDFTTSPIGFAWPPGRSFSSSTANKAPCGGSPAGERADYPLSGGDISLTAKTLFDNVNILWTNETDPTRFHAFSTYTNSLSELGGGHYCQPAPDFASLGLKAGDDVTLMIMYNFQDVADNFYYCADINLVAADGFKPAESYMCTNATSSLQVASDKDSMKVGSSSSSTSSDVSSSEGSPASAVTTSAEAASGDSGLSAAAGGGIGAAVTVIVIAALAAAAYVFGYVRFGKKKPVVLADHASDSTGVPIKATKF